MFKYSKLKNFLYRLAWGGMFVVLVVLIFFIGLYFYNNYYWNGYRVNNIDYHIIRDEYESKLISNPILSDDVRGYLYEYEDVAWEVLNDGPTLGSSSVNFIDSYGKRTENVSKFNILGDISKIYFNNPYIFVVYFDSEEDPTWNLSIYNTKTGKRKNFDPKVSGCNNAGISIVGVAFKDGILYIEQSAILNARCSGYFKRNYNLTF